MDDFVLRDGPKPRIFRVVTKLIPGNRFLYRIWTKSPSVFVRYEDKVVYYYNEDDITKEIHRVKSAEFDRMELYTEG